MIVKLEQLAILMIPIISIPTLNSYTSSMAHQFIIFIFTQYLPILIPESIPYLCATVIIALIIRIKRYKHSPDTEKPDPRLLFDVARFLTITQTTITIFLCDFNFWNRRFSKNDGYTIGLMDLGLGCFMFCNGIVSSLAKKSKLVKNGILMFLLGVLRLLVVKGFNLHVSPKEYGVHWNFYFTISAVIFIFLIIDLPFKSVPGNLILGVILLTLYELASPIVEEIIFSDERYNLIMQNKEGLISLIPFTGFYLILNHVGRLLFGKDAKNTLRNLGTMWWINIFVYLTAGIYSSASRRLCNVSYLSWILVIMFTFIWILGKISHHYPEMIRNTTIITLSSRKMFPIFLGSNLLVLIFKLCFDLKNVSYITGNIMNMLYLWISIFALPYILSRKLSNVSKYGV